MTAQRLRDRASNVLYRPAAALLAHPRFGDARACYVDGLLRLYSNAPFLSRMMGEATRAVLFGLIIAFHVGYRPDDRATWPTLANIQRILQTYGLSSPRRIEALVARLAQVGYLDAEPAPDDQRSRLLRPGAAMMAHDREWLANHYAPLALLFPDDSTYDPPLARDPAFHRAQRRAAAGTILHSARTLVTNDAVMLFGARTAGFLIVAALADAAARAGDGVARVPIAELARRFAVSRAHVRRMLVEGDRAGLIAFDPFADRGVLLLPPLWAGIDRFVAEALERHDLTAAIALRALSEGQGLH